MKLDKIKSEQKQEEILSILHDRHPVHSQRVWMTGFLAYAGYTDSEISSIVDVENHWEDYDRFYTKSQIRSVLGSRRNGKHASIGEAEYVQSSQKRTWVHVMIDYSKHSEYCKNGCDNCIDCHCVEANRYLKNLNKGW